MRGSLLVVIAVAVALAGPARPARAQAPDAEAIRREIAQLRREFEELRKSYGERLAALEARIAEAPASQPAPAPAPPPAPAAVEAPAAQPGASAPGGLAGSKVFNPDVAVVGNFLGAAGSARGDPDPARALELHESEVSLQAVVDPYARADFFISFGETGVNVEEGFVTFPSIPGGLLVKAGKMRAAFGKVNGLHTHVLPWADRPLVTRNLVGGEDGISDAGVSVARIIPNRWVFLEATGQVFRGDSAGVFRSGQRGDLACVAHLRGYGDISESTNVDLGASFTRGHNDSGLVDGVDEGRFTTRLYGMDATLRWRPLQRSIYHSFMARTELVWSQRDQPGGPQTGFGYYVSGDYQFGRRWFAGVRIDRSTRAADAGLVDTGQALVLTFVPSEFSRVRGMYRRTLYARQAAAAHELLLQIQFGIGAHGAHAF